MGSGSGSGSGGGISCSSIGSKTTSTTGSGSGSGSGSGVGVCVGCFTTFFSGRLVTTGGVTFAFKTVVLVTVAVTDFFALVLLAGATEGLTKGSDRSTTPLQTEHTRDEGSARGFSTSLMTRTGVGTDAGAGSATTASPHFACSCSCLSDNTSVINTLIRSFANSNALRRDVSEETPSKLIRGLVFN